MSRYDGTIHLVGRVMVDSGQVMVGDPCYLDDFKAHNAFGTGLSLDPADCKLPYEYSYEGASQATCSAEGFGEIGEGQACSVSSGYGDGSYPVYAEKNREGRVVALHVYFDEDPNEERRYCPSCGENRPEEHFCGTCGECECSCRDGECDGCDGDCGRDD